mmetsp:Transcript_12907/g.14191  ORF Transcript_12907/g.14191 Transcript_12907/m.14191 type:complete len:85 (+) Transcript_12907:489-743(+)
MRTKHQAKKYEVTNTQTTARRFDERASPLIKTRILGIRVTMLLSKDRHNRIRLPNLRLRQQKVRVDGPQMPKNLDGILGVNIDL